ncbi:MAG: 16S rRNA (guanine(527)-N(7))-methyltransferase RsmG [Pseudomonadota bacterium]|jgi:16S rRNA (guanine527-N7)-methyltransferase|nr:16S rRNA (guanine(527)-N(7))-methyltransferase RsmG [Pseudomonadota bacterium]
MEPYRQTLERALKPLKMSLTEAQRERLLAYHQLLLKWNRAYNLTAVRDPVQMIDRHLVDSLSILPWIGKGRLLDAGSGAGLPGIPVAIARPGLEVTTLDSNGKKTRFQQQVRIELGLDNLTVINDRAERLDGPPFDMIVSRAFASLSDMLTLTHHLLAPNGVFLAMKGLYPEAELEQIPAEFALREVHRLNLPDTDGERHLLILGRI